MLNRALSVLKHVFFGSLDNDAHYEFDNKNCREPFLLEIFLPSFVIRKFFTPKFQALKIFISRILGHECFFVCDLDIIFQIQGFEIFKIKISNFILKKRYEKAATVY